MALKKFKFSFYIQEDVKYVTFKTSIEEYLDNTTELLHQLQRCFKVSENGTFYRLQVGSDVIKQLEKCLTHFIQVHTKEETDLVIIEIYRSLRNCATNQEVQNFIFENTIILDLTRTCIEMLKDREQNCIKIILQFMINLISSNKSVARKVNVQFLEILANLEKRKIWAYEFSALVYNLSLIEPINEHFIEIMFKLYESGDNEFILFFIENCIASCDCWNIYNNLTTIHKLVILESIRNQQIQNKKCTIPYSGLTVLINSFLKSPDIFFNINKQSSQEIGEVSLLLEIVSSFSSNDDYIGKLQENKNILVTAAALLINFHRLGKNGSNLFTPVQKLSESQENIIINPVFGLKADLIRLIGNMCWKNVTMQNLAREAEIIPVILDCCNIDANNPFILQWSIFAIRNLCDKNQENQKLIAGLHKKGAVSSSVLEEFGVTLHDKGDNQIKIVSLDSLHI